MSEPTKIEEVYSALEESSRLQEVTCSRDKVWPILTAYQDGLAEARIVFSIAANERHKEELDYTLVVPVGALDPYSVALSNGLTVETEHPVGALLSDILERCPVGSYGVDCGVVGGFKKTLACFPPGDLQVLSKLAEIPSMPRSLAENASSFARYGLHDNVAIIAVDCRDRTINVYFGRPQAERLEPETVLSMLREMGLPEPSEQMLEFTQQSFSIYVTLGWDSSEVKRICFAKITTDATEPPARTEPGFGRFARSAPYAYAGERILVYGSTLSASGEFYKLGSYYQITPETQGLLAASGAPKDWA